MSDGLSDRQREAASLVLLDGLTLRAAADVMDCSHVNVGKLVRAALMIMEGGGRCPACGRSKR